MTTWKKVKLGDIVDIKRGASPRPIQKFLSDTGIPWIKISDATSEKSRYIKNTKQYILKSGKNNSVYLSPGTLILSNSGTPGIPKILDIHACVHDGWLIFNNYKNILRDFLYYFFVYSYQLISSRANGSVFQNLKIDILKNFDILIPDLKIQEKIISLLLNIDNKIDINNKINDNLTR